MSALLADTHAVVWYLFQPVHLSSAADAALSAAAAAGDSIFVSAISLVEVVYLIDKGKLPAPTLTRLVLAITDPAVCVVLLPVDLSVAEATQRIPRSIVPDLPDRIIAATGLAHGLPVVTADRKIRAAPVPTIW